MAGNNCCDRNGSRKVQFRECGTPLSDEMIDDLYKAFASRGTTKVKAARFAKMVRALGLTKNDVEEFEMLRAIGVDRHGMTSVRRFCDWLKDSDSCSIRAKETMLQDGQ
eukprot:TRINITY_DN1874_c0_g4_i1.p1 TRINITY_DN1874_c0_g4~~TRINITY_DN1874_c0_g4_i1.p1  ORF type:complete len:109 (-),score=16.56 TRINITY_DN1874_c0_g4_i1:408-734(-)